MYDDMLRPISQFMVNDVNSASTAFISQEIVQVSVFGWVHLELLVTEEKKSPPRSGFVHVTTRRCRADVWWMYGDLMGRLFECMPSPNDAQDQFLITLPSPNDAQD